MVVLYLTGFEWQQAKVHGNSCQASYIGNDLFAYKAADGTQVSNSVAATRTSGYAIYSDTGQNSCYDNEKSIDCPSEGEEFYWQDAQFLSLAPLIETSVFLHAKSERYLSVTAVYHIWMDTNSCFHVPFPLTAGGIICSFQSRTAHPVSCPCLVWRSSIADTPASIRWPRRGVSAGFRSIQH